MDEEKLGNDSTPNLLKSLDSNDESEEIDESFQCCVCLDLLYKPIVLACGHVSCFWCVHRAMSGMSESHCPICRCPYTHFPSICQMLHFLLLKMYPVAYNRREKQVLEEEKNQGCFSPQFENSLSTTNICTKSSTVASPTSFSATCSVDDVAQYSDTCSDGNINPSATVEQRPPDFFLHEKTSTVSGDAGLEATTLAFKENRSKDNAWEVISIDDVLCVACNQLLFQPAVLNCGHVYCQSCTTTEIEEALRCQLCQSIHPNKALKVCLELDHLLEKRFPKEYALRREAVKCQPIHGQDGNSAAGTEQDDKHSLKSTLTWSYLSWLGERGLSIHIGVGCDYCGMYPIVGDRYKCQDCVEQIGFDLCGECYNTRSKLPGRFNQQHTPEHKFVLETSQLMRSIMSAWVSENSEDSSIPILSDGSIPMRSDDTSEDPEDGLPSNVHFDDAPGDQEGDT